MLERASFCLTGAGEGRDNGFRSRQWRVSTSEANRLVVVCMKMKIKWGHFVPDKVLTVVVKSLYPKPCLAEQFVCDDSSI